MAKVVKPQLFIGNRNYSSWSLRPWLCLTWANIPFDEVFIDLDQPGYGGDGIADILAVSPSGKVPALRLGNTVIWDSLAIAEWAAEQPGAAPLLPRDPLVRAQLRSVVAEMHSSFAGLRRDLSMNIRRRCTAKNLPADTLRDIRRVEELWAWCRATHGAGGPYLFGARSMADAFYLPVVTRFRTYGIAVSPKTQAYCELMLQDDAFRIWEAKVLAEPVRIFSQAPIDALFAD